VQTILKGFLPFWHPHLWPQRSPPILLQGNPPPPSLYSTIYWPNFPKPPKNFWQLWCHFLHFHISSYLVHHTMAWFVTSPPRYIINTYKHSNHPHLFQYTNGQMSRFPLLPRQRSGHKTTYNHVPYISEILPTDPDLWPVDTHNTTKGLIIISSNCINTHKHLMPLPSQTLQKHFAALPWSFQDIVGHINHPPDDVLEIIQSINDTSFKDGHAFHAWILSTGAPEDITNPQRDIHGGGSPWFLSLSLFWQGWTTRNFCTIHCCKYI